MADSDLLPSLAFEQPCPGEQGSINVQETAKVRTTNNSGDDIYEAAQLYLQHQLKLLDEEVSAGHIFAALRQQKREQLFSPERRKQYLKHFTAAYALMLVMERPVIGPELVQQLREEQEADRKGADNPALLALRKVIDYSGNDEEEKRQGRTQLSTDAGALRYLQDQNVSPDAVMALSAQHGEGRKEWYKRYRERNKRDRQSEGVGEEAAVDLPPTLTADEGDSGAREITSVTGRKSGSGELILRFTAVDTDFPPLRLTPDVAKELRALLESAGYHTRASS